MRKIYSEKKITVNSYEAAIQSSAILLIFQFLFEFISAAGSFISELGKNFLYDINYNDDFFQNRLHSNICWKPPADVRPTGPAVVAKVVGIGGESESTHRL